MDNTRELYEIITDAKAVRARLENLISSYEEQDEDVTELDEAADALSDAVEILEDYMA